MSDEVKIKPVEDGGSISVYHTEEIKRLEADNKKMRELVKEVAYESISHPTLSISFQRRVKQALKDGE